MMLTLVLDWDLIRFGIQALKRRMLAGRCDVFFPAVKEQEEGKKRPRKRERERERERERVRRRERKGSAVPAARADIDTH